MKGDLSGVLTADHSPYQVTDTIVVDSGASLTIESGVQLHFADSARFVIHGRVEAVGQSNRFISFTAFDETWKGIGLIDADVISTFRFCIFEKIRIDRMDPSDYGGVEINNSKAIIQNCIFRGNFGTNGGGLSLLGDTSMVTNNIFRDNEAEGYGGAILAFESASQIINNTFYRNFCTNVGGGLVLVLPAGVDIQNNIFFENIANSGDPGIWLIPADSSGVNQRYNFLPGQNDDPRFISDDDLHLRIDSPCINAGNPDSVYNDTDGTRNDQGAYGGPRGNW